MKKILAVFLSVALILGNGITGFAQEISEDVSDTVEYSAEDTAIESAEETAVETNSSEETEISESEITFISVSKASLSKTETQSVVVGFENLTDSIENVYLTVINSDTETRYDVAESSRTENSILFEESFTENGVYEITELSYTKDEAVIEINLSDIGIDAGFGVNEKVAMDADAVVVEEDPEAADETAELTEALAEEELDTNVITIDAANYEESTETLMTALAASAVTADTSSTDSNIVVVLDPGHGGNDGGASATHSGVTYVEKTLNLKIAQYCKAELEQYKGITVYLTRSTDVYLSLKERVDYAASVGADVFVSIHNNSSNSSSANGAYVYYPNSHYDADIGSEGQKLATQIANELASLGLVNHGAVTRSASIDTYPDGTTEDYYGVIRRSKYAGFPGLIVEHAFISNASDASKYLSSETALKNLGVADATGIAKYFGLSKTKTVSSSVRSTTPYVTYRSHVSNVGWQSYVQDGATSGTTGQSQQIEAMNIRINPKSSISGGITYKAHVQDVGWQDWVSDGEMTGTAGQSKRVEAIRIQLTGNLANYYDVYYRVHSQDYGWLGWAKNGESAGTEGYGLRMEAIQIVLVAKGASAPGSTANHFVSDNKEIIYSAHVQNIGWQNNAVSGETAGTTGRSLRVEALKINLADETEGSVSYRAHVQDVGWQDWVSDGAISGTVGESLRVEALQIKLSGTIADSYDVYYRTHVENVGWTSWVKNGATSGTTGRSLRVEAVQIKLVKK